VNADDDSLSDAINNEQPVETRTLSKPELRSEYRGPGKITAAALQIFCQEEKSAQRRSRKSAKYSSDMLIKACRNFERFFELAEGEAYEEWIDEHSMKVPEWAEANVEEFVDIQRRKDNREANSLIGGCSTIANDQTLCPLIEKTPQGLNSVSPAEWVLIDVIADSGACETVMPKGLCSNITLRESAQSKAGVEYEVASGKAVPNLGERHCEIFCEGAESSMMMHFQVADIHKPLLSLSRAADQGFRSYLDWYGGYLEDTKTGETIPIQR
jgi:hypothetical protein